MLRPGLFQASLVLGLFSQEPLLVPITLLVVVPGTPTVAGKAPTVTEKKLNLGRHREDFNHKPAERFCPVLNEGTDGAGEAGGAANGKPVPLPPKLFGAGEAIPKPLNELLVP